MCFSSLYWYATVDCLMINICFNPKLQNYIIMCLIMSSMWAFVAVSIYINIFLNMIHFTTFGTHKISL